MFSALICVTDIYKNFTPYSITLITIGPVRCINIKCTPVQALRLCTGRTAHKRSRGIALLFLGHGTRSGEGSASLPDRYLPPENTRYTLYRRLGGPRGRCGQVRKVVLPHRVSIPGPSSPKPIAIPTELPGPRYVVYFT